MPKPTKGPRLGGSPAHQRLILANLAKSLIEHESIVTTEAKARRLRPYVEKLITKARRGDIHNRRMVARKLGSKVSKYVRETDAVYRLFDVVVPKIDPAREGGYTRIVKLPPRKGDNTPMAQISLVFDKLEKKAVVQKAEADTKRVAKQSEEAGKATVEAKKADTDVSEAAAVESKSDEAAESEAAAEA